MAVIVWFVPAVVTVNDSVRTPAEKLFDGVSVIIPAVVVKSTAPAYEVTVLSPLSSAVIVTENGIPAVCVDMAEIAKWSNAPVVIVVIDAGADVVEL